MHVYIRFTRTVLLSAWVLYRLQLAQENGKLSFTKHLRGQENNKSEREKLHVEFLENVLGIRRERAM